MDVSVACSSSVSMVAAIAAKHPRATIGQDNKVVLDCVVGVAWIAEEVSNTALLSGI